MKIKLLLVILCIVIAGCEFGDLTTEAFLQLDVLGMNQNPGDQTPPPENPPSNPPSNPPPTDPKPPQYISIFDEDDFEQVRADTSKNYRLMNDIILTKNFIPIAGDADPTTSDFDGDAFTGIFDGNEKTIRGLKIDQSGNSYVGMFGKIGSGGLVQKLTLELVSGSVQSPSVHGTNGVGALAGVIEGDARIDSVVVSGGFVYGENGLGTGGLVGAILPQGVGSLLQQAGQLASAASNVEIMHSHATAEVKGRQYVGGLVGINTGTIGTSFASKKVDGIEHSGGLVGINTKIISLSYAVGAVGGTGNKIGGLVGINTGSIERSYARGNVTAGTGTDIGGLVGENSNIIRASYATGDVAGVNYIGGLVGINKGSIARSYATGMIVAGDPAATPGGLVGQADSSDISDSYFDAILTTPSMLFFYPGAGNNLDLAGIKTYFTNPTLNPRQVYRDTSYANIITQDDFSNWNFTNIWNLTDGQWPTLRQ